MFSLFLIIVASCVPFVVTWITSPEEIFLTSDEAKPRQIFKKNTTKRLSKKGIWFVAAIILTWTLAGIQFVQNEKDKSLLKTERDIRDSIITTKINHGVDSNRKVLFKDLSEALAKQNLRLDSVTNKLEVLRDSMGGRVTFVETEAPVLDFCPDGIILQRQTADTCEFIVKVCSQNAACRNVNLSLYILVSANKEKEIFNDLKLHSINPNYLSKNLSIGKDGSKQQGLDVYGSNISAKKSFIFLLVGSYFNSTGRKRYEVNSMGLYYLDIKKFGYVSSPFDDQIRNYLRNLNALKK